MNKLSGPRCSACFRQAMSALLTSLVLAFPLFAQGLQDLEFGEDDTFEVLTWNIEWFPKSGQITIDAVAQIIEALDVDLLALQEINDTATLQQMVDGIDGYDAYYDSAWPAGLAYVYKTDSLTVVNTYEIYTTQPYWSPFPRSPMVMEVLFNGELVIVINNHFKCCGNGVMNLNDPGDEETRRYIASNLLRQYVEDNLADDKVIILGDLNDTLTDNLANNVFQGFLDDPANYAFVDMGIATGSSADWSYPTWPSHLDHLLITNELFDAIADSAAEVECIRIDDFLPGGWSEYDANVSDHRPVALKVPLGPSGSGCPTETIASETPRLGTPPNADALQPGASSPPVIGTVWDPWIDHTTFLTDATLDGLILAVLPLNVPSNKGTLLCDVSPTTLIITQPAGSGFLLPIPMDCILAGLPLCVQGFSKGPSGAKLTNALDITVGTLSGN